MLGAFCLGRVQRWLPTSCCHFLLSTKKLALGMLKRGWLMLSLFWIPSTHGQQMALGFADSLLFDASQSYHYGDYQASRPLRVMAWFQAKPSNRGFLTFGELLMGVSTHNRNAWDAQQQQAKLECWRDNAFVDLATAEALGAAEDLENDQHHLMLLATDAQSHDWPAAGQFPVVIYHHGSRGFGAENYQMAEKWAKAGFLVLAADFHLPHLQWAYGLAEGIDSSMASLRCLFAFAQRLAGKQAIYFAGHSWGAQQGWRFLAEDAPPIKGFISLETTLEYKTNAAEIADKWPYLYESFISKGLKVKVPVLAVAARTGSLPFPFLSHKTTGWQAQLGVVPEFAHEAFTSLPFLRLHLPMQPDDQLLRAQQGLYHDLGKLLLHFLQTPGSTFPEPIDPTQFEIVYRQP